ncbi:MAG: hypothetical protein IH594_14430 [Bacteroidales bacterium]|nr:hypothetical protein [Bacteroidales bacterium]
MQPYSGFRKSNGGDINVEALGGNMTVGSILEIIYQMAGNKKARFREAGIQNAKYLEVTILMEVINLFIP